MEEPDLDNMLTSCIFTDGKATEHLDLWLDNEAYSNLFILVDDNTHSLCLPLLVAQSRHLISAHILEVEPGESSKCFDIVHGLLETLIDEGADRKSILIILGGGVVSDLGGFVASIYMRGIRTIHIPTTLLAMTDATIGGKTGINFLGRKNSVGSFHRSALILIQQSFLATLPQEEIISGFAEVVKHALIEGGEWWSLIQRTNPSEVNDWTYHLQKSIELKSSLVKRDAFEKGPRQQLNLGHTVAHALEALFLKHQVHLSHGAAVAAGILIEAYIATLEGVLNDNHVLIDIEKYILKQFPNVTFHLEQLPEILLHMRSDKKNVAGEITFSLLSSLGNVLIGCKSSDENIMKALERYLHHAGNN